MEKETGGGGKIETEKDKQRRCWKEFGIYGKRNGRWEQDRN